MQESCYLLHQFQIILWRHQFEGVQKSVLFRLDCLEKSSFVYTLFDQGTFDLAKPWNVAGINGTIQLAPDELQSEVQLSLRNVRNSFQFSRIKTFSKKKESSICPKQTTGIIQKPMQQSLSRQLQLVVCQRMLLLYNINRGKSELKKPTKL